VVGVAVVRIAVELGGKRGGHQQTRQRSSAHIDVAADVGLERSRSAPTLASSHVQSLVFVAVLAGRRVSSMVKVEVQSFQSADRRSQKVAPVRSGRRLTHSRREERAQSLGAIHWTKSWGQAASRHVLAGQMLVVHAMWPFSTQDCRYRGL
jgi:hypothetical protein